MRLPAKLALACLTAAALATGPAISASASVQHSQHAAAAPGSATIAIPVHMVPGTHTVAQEIPVTTNPSPGTSKATPNFTLGGSHSVSVRVGKNDCGGFNGNLSWGATTDMSIQGTLWDDCDYYTPNTTVYLYVSWQDLLGTHHEQEDQVSGWYSSLYVYGFAVPGGYIFTTGSPGNIWVGTCLSWNNGFGCGPAEHMT